jgi:hypothetical protein
MMPFTMVDLGLGAEEYKERFANQSRETLYVTSEHPQPTTPRDRSSRGSNGQDISETGSCTRGDNAIA